MVSVSDGIKSRRKFGRTVWRCKKNNLVTIDIKGETTDLTLTVEFLNLYLVYSSSLQLLGRKMVFPFLSVHLPPLIFLTVKVNNYNSWEGEIIV